MHDFINLAGKFFQITAHADLTFFNNIGSQILAQTHGHLHMLFNQENGHPVVLELFDNRPHIAFSQGDGVTELDLEGDIDKQDAWITIRDRPDEDEEPVGIIDKDGGFSEFVD